MPRPFSDACVNELVAEFVMLRKEYDDMVPKIDEIKKRKDVLDSFLRSNGLFDRVPPRGETN